MMKAIPQSPSNDEIAAYLRSTLASGRVIPGYGHGVLRQPDPRFETLVAFGASRPEIAGDPHFQMVQKLSEIAPVVLKEHGKVCTTVSTQPACTVCISETANQTFVDQEPLSQCRLGLRGPVPSLWVHADTLLHGNLRGQPSLGPFGTVDLVKDIGLPH